LFWSIPWCFLSMDFFARRYYILYAVERGGKKRRNGRKSCEGRTIVSIPSRRRAKVSLSLLDRTSRSESRASRKELRRKVASWFPSLSRPAKLPVVSGKKVIKALHNAGFDRIRTKGDHVFLRHPDGRRWGGGNAMRLCRRVFQAGIQLTEK